MNNDSPTSFPMTGARRAESPTTPARVGHLSAAYLDPHHVGKDDEDYTLGFERTSLDGPTTPPVWTVEPYTYTDRGVASLGYELVDDNGKRVGIFDDIPTARIAANFRGADVRLSWEAR